MKHKTIKAMLISMGVMGGTAFAQEQLNVYNWSDYIAPGALKQFEKETGIKVNYDVYSSNEVLEAKLMAGRSGYDLVVPSNSFLERQIAAGIYQPIDKSKLSNYGNLDPAILKSLAANDPGNKYAVPYMWGTIGLGYNVDMIKKRLGVSSINSLDVLFDPKIVSKLKDCGVTVLDSPAEVIDIVNNYRGIDPNSQSPAELKKSAEVLRAVRPYYKYFDSSRYISDLANGEVCLVLGYNGDVLQAKTRAEEAGQGVKIDFVVPKEGTLAFLDTMAIPKDAQHPAAALKFINFILNGKNSATLSNYVFYASPNTAAEPFLDPDVKNNKAIYPPESVKDKLFVQKTNSARFDRLLTRAWTNIKTGR
ncbi:Putrescine-binding periplasmic protein precursor [Marinomonas spartinae]|uniref:Putrescine-binding periplasmic protein n=1 Tax=Marinomonas spartinae TaxID=1792290 RepID=A0A1A8TT50_9GAMM|nr:polyamine ABC transporter substrate-binding protein [Marinomonas spartinae]SBS30447.1 Putrescine-binding periplasmic protein precursor [Marinomonas spartinae]SBS36222.1 Putrescine-binding periplasmic protein precursor [Marinomonas spartinae]